jgi:8-hydroxy-5-deazaflavin:NADPH oxidoreductase
VRIAIIGAGTLGTALGARLAGAGHDVMFAGPGAEEVALALGAGYGSNTDAASLSEVVAICVPFTKAARALAETGGARGKVVWSCVRALNADGSGLVVGFDDSAGEQIARLAPAARVVAAIPPVASTLAGGSLEYDAGLAPSVFVCGEDGDAKATVTGLLGDLGLHAVDAGGIRAARLVEPAVMLVTSIADAGGRRDVGIRLLER